MLQGQDEDSGPFPCSCPQPARIVAHSLVRSCSPPLSKNNSNLPCGGPETGVVLLRGAMGACCGSAGREGDTEGTLVTQVRPQSGFAGAF